MFGVSTATAQRVVQRVCKAITKLLMPKHIAWPAAEELAAHAARVKDDYQLSGVAGFIDGTYIRVFPRNTLERVYCYNRKGFHSIILQGIVDRDGRFINAHIGWPGRVHDARAFSQSAIAQQMVSLPEHSSLLPEPYVLLADAAYPLTSWCITPYPAAVTVEERLFNGRHSSARMAVERAFGKLKAQWGLLVKNISYNAVAMPNLVAAACTLHNITIDVADDTGWVYTPSGEAGTIEEDEQQPLAPHDVALNGVVEGDRHSLAAGRQKRSSISSATLTEVALGLITL